MVTETPARARKACEPELPFTPAMLASKPADYLLLPAEVASLFRVSHKTVSRWRAGGKINAAWTPGNHQRFLVAEVRRRFRELSDGSRP